MKLTLLKVVVQPHFVALDGDVERELVAEPMVVSAKECPGFAEGEFREAFQALAENVEDDRG